MILLARTGVKGVITRCCCTWHGKSFLGLSSYPRRAAGSWREDGRLYHVGDPAAGRDQPVPERGATTWADFLRSHADALLACDFFEAVTLVGALPSGGSGFTTPSGSQRLRSRGMSGSGERSCRSPGTLLLVRGCCRRGEPARVVVGKGLLTRTAACAQCNGHHSSPGWDATTAR